MANLSASVKGSGSAQARVNLLLGGRKGEALSIGISIGMTLVVRRRGKGREVAVVGREFGCPDAVRGGGATKGTVQAGHLPDLRRIEVEQNRRHAALRHVAEGRLPPLPIRDQDARTRTHFYDPIATRDRIGDMKA
jgi:hypothetical protein